jgi:hypothetical protein
LFAFAVLAPLPDFELRVKAAAPGPRFAAARSCRLE